MYKVFISSRPIYFCSKADSAQLPNSVSRVKRRSLFPTDVFLDAFDKGSHPHGCWVKLGKKQRNWRKFYESLTEIAAAGGAVRDEGGRLLFIFRRGHWDLPKGKIEKGEGIEEAAVREVEEECGIDGVRITAPLITTLHGFKNKHGWCIKPSYWYLMTHNPDSCPTPQTEEDISEVTWLSEAEFNQKSPVFANVVDVARAAFTCP